ncbi:unnamed protein product, partial [Meganyctiphanes norvegica]
MPRKKGSRKPAARAKPTVPDDSFVEVDMEREVKMEKMKLILADFDEEAEKRIGLMEEEIKNIQQSIKQMYKRELLRISSTTRDMLWVDYIKQKSSDGESLKKTRQSIDQLLGSADELLKSTKKKGKKTVQISEENLPQTANRTSKIAYFFKSKVSKQKYYNSAMKKIQSIRKNQRSAKELGVPGTPLNHGVPSKNPELLITPKFDPRTPLPPSTVKRLPRLGEIAISLKGSPLQTGPKDWFENLEPGTLDNKTKEELLAFREKVNNLLKI